MKKKNHSEMLSQSSYSIEFRTLLVPITHAYSLYSSQKLAAATDGLIALALPSVIVAIDEQVL